MKIISGNPITQANNFKTNKDISFAGRGGDREKQPLIERSSNYHVGCTAFNI